MPPTDESPVRGYSDGRQDADSWLATLSLWKEYE
jgi:hypothetical protein